MSSLLLHDDTRPAGNTVGNTAVATVITSSYPFGINDLNPDKMYDLVCRADITTKADPAGTLRVQVKIGSKVVLDTTATAVPGSLASRGVWLRGRFRPVTGGAAGTMEAQGDFSIATDLGFSFPLPMRNAAILTAIDYTTALTMTITVTWGTADASNTITFTMVSLTEVTQ